MGAHLSYQIFTAIGASDGKRYTVRTDVGYSIRVQYSNEAVEILNHTWY